MGKGLVRVGGGGGGQIVTIKTVENISYPDNTGKLHFKLLHSWLTEVDYKRYRGQKFHSSSRNYK